MQHCSTCRKDLLAGEFSFPDDRTCKRHLLLKKQKRARGGSPDPPASGGDEAYNLLLEGPSHPPLNMPTLQEPSAPLEVYLCVEPTSLDAILRDGFFTRSRPNVAVSTTVASAQAAFSKNNPWVLGVVLRCTLSIQNAPDLKFFLNGEGKPRLQGNRIPPRHLRVFDLFDLRSAGVERQRRAMTRPNQCMHSVLRASLPVTLPFQNGQD